MGHAEVFALHDVVARYWRFRGYEVLNPMGWDSFGLPAENAAIRNDEHPATYTYANIETQAESMKQLRAELRLVPAAAHQRPGVLPLDAVAVPEVPRARAGLPQEQPGQLVPQRPDRAGQRAGRRRHVRALRRRGHQARADPVVLQDHRLRPAAAGRHGAAGGHLARPGADRAAQLDRPLRGRPRRLRGRGPRRADRPSTRPVRTRCSARRSWWSPPTRRWPPSWSPTSSGRRTRPTWQQVRKETEIDRLSTERPKTGVFLGVHAVNPANGERIPVWAADYVLADYGTGAIMAVPGAGPARLGVRDDVRPADRAHRAAARRLGGRGLHRRGPGDQLRQRRDLAWTGWASTRRSARSPTGWRSEAPGEGTVNFRLRDWLLSRQRYWGVPIPIDPLRRSAARSPCPTTSCRSSCPSCAAPT